MSLSTNILKMNNIRETEFTCLPHEHVRMVTVDPALLRQLADKIQTLEQEWNLVIQSHGGLALLLLPN